MGNCCRHQHSSSSLSSTDWGGEEWDSPKLAKTSDGAELIGDRLLGEERNWSSSREVKITITKRELEELLESLEVDGPSMEQVLSQLIGVSNEYDQQHTQQNSWRPALKSIPELN